MKVKDVVESVGTLSHKNRKYDNLTKHDAENEYERGELERLKREILANFDKKINDDIFHGKLRLYIPVSSDYEPPVIKGIGEYRYELSQNAGITMKWQGEVLDRGGMIAVFRELKSVLLDAGYTIDDYVNNRAVTQIQTQQGMKEKTTSISKILSKSQDNGLISFFNNDPIRTGSASKDVQIVISRHPHDIGAMSTHRSWDSCMNLRKGMYRDKVANDVKEGTLVAYLIDKSDRKVERPKARLAIKPFVSTRDPTDIALGVEETTYGQANPGFSAAVVDWANKVNAIRVKGKGRYNLPTNLYRDSHASLLYGIKTDYPEGSVAQRLATQQMNPSSVQEADMTPEVLNALIDIESYSYCAIPPAMAHEYRDEYVKVFVDQLKTDRTNLGLLSVIDGARPEIVKPVLDQVFGENPLTKVERDKIVKSIEDRPNNIAAIPPAMLTPEMLLAGMKSSYFNARMIQPGIFFQNPEVYFDILDACNLRFKYILTPIFDMPKEVWGSYSERARKCFLDGLYNENHIDYYFDLIKSVTPQGSRHQIVEFIFQHEPQDNLVAYWKSYYLRYPQTAEFNLIPFRYLKLFLAEMVEQDYYVLSRVPDSLFNTDRGLYDQLVKIAYEQVGDVVPRYINNPSISKHYEQQLSQKQPHVESINRIAELAGYKINVLK